MSNCPKCKQDTLIDMRGGGWDWDKKLCMNRGCDYEVELDTMTCHEPDGSIYIMHKEDDDEDNI